MLRVDTARKIVRKDTVLDTIDSIYKLHKEKSKEEKRNLVQQQLLNVTVMTNYGKAQFYRIQDIEFKKLTDVYITEEENLLDYYERRYNIKV